MASVASYVIACTVNPVLAKQVKRAMLSRRFKKDFTIMLINNE